MKGFLLRFKYLPGLLVIAFVVAMIINAVTGVGRYGRFRAKLAESICQTEINGGIRADSKEGSVKLNEECQGALYAVISGGGYYQYTFRNYQGKRLVHLVFLQGDYLTISKIKGKQRYFVVYQLKHKRGHFFMSRRFDEKRLETIVAPTGSEGRNERWREDFLDREED